jgi:hypothetical protein
MNQKERARFYESQYYSLKHALTAALKAGSFNWSKPTPVATKPGGSPDFEIRYVLLQEGELHSTLYGQHVHYARSQSGLGQRDPFNSYKVLNAEEMAKQPASFLQGDPEFYTAFFALYTRLKAEHDEIIRKREEFTASLPPASRN